MLKATAVFAAGMLMLVGIVEWAYPSHRPLEAKASNSTEAQIDTFGIMSTAKYLPTEEFQDFSFVFSSPMFEPTTP